MDINLPLLEIRNASKKFAVGRDTFFAVQDVSFSIEPGETLGLVGESGSGKSTLAKLLVKLHTLTSGSIIYRQTDISTMSASMFRPYRRDLQLVFQDPYSSLNPRMKVKDIVKEGLEIHYIDSAPDILENILFQVGLPKSFLDKYPQELSGGQRQRIGIARALAVNPKFLIFDESLSSLDLQTQVQMIHLLTDLQKKHKLTFLFISHDIGTVFRMSHRIGVMYMGEIIELGTSSAIIQGALHPYTNALLNALPIPDPKVERKRDRIFLTGDPPSHKKPIKGCPYHTQCPMAMPMCEFEKPLKKEVTDGHSVACHLF